MSLLNGYVEMLRERSLGPLTAAQDRVLERIAEKSMQLAQLLDAVETAVRLDKGRIPVYEVNVTHEVNDAVLRAQSRVEARAASSTPPPHPLSQLLPTVCCSAGSSTP